MNLEWLDGLPGIVLRSSISLAVAAVGVAILLRLLRLRSPLLHRVAWAVVLIQGCIFTRVALEIPWLEPSSTFTANRATLTSSVRPDPMNQRYTPAPAESKTLAAAASDHQHPVQPASATREHVSSQEHQMLLSPSDDAATAGGVANKGSSDAKNAGWSGRWLINIWLAGVAVVLILHGLAYHLLNWSLRKSVLAPVAWRKQWQEMLRQAGVRTHIQMRVHPALGPMIIRRLAGYQIVVPRELWEELGDHQRSAVLRHELAHYLRGDIWKSCLARVVALPHWFNPLAWLAVRKFDESSEWACDRYLMEHDPASAAPFAHALLRVVQFPRPIGVGLRGAGGSLLSERIRRLCGVHAGEDTNMKRMIAVTLFLLVMLGGLAEFRLVERALAQGTDSPETAAQQSQTEAAEMRERWLNANQLPQRIQEFAERIVVDESDATILDFKQALHTGAGQTALMERAAWIENELRRESQLQALPWFFDQHFERSGEQLALKPDHQEFKQTVLTQTSRYQSDVEDVERALQQLAEQLADEHESEKIIRRALAKPMTAWVIYATEIRRRLRPDERTIQQIFQGVFVVAPGGEVLIRPNVRAQIEEQLGRGAQRRSALPQIRQELNNYSQDISEFDETHQQLKQIFADDFFAVVCCYQTVGPEGNAEQGMRNLFNYLEHLFEDHSDGLRLNDEARQQAVEMIERFTARRAAAERLKQPLKQFASRIPDNFDELHDQVKRALQHELNLAHITRDDLYLADSASMQVRMMIGERFVENEDGRLHVPQELRGEIIEFARDLLRTGRDLRRRFAAIDTSVSNIKDPELRAAFESLAGKYLVQRSINQQFAGQRFDGLGEWIGMHFTETDERLALKPDARPEIEEFLKQVEQINAELAKDDF